jgi:hypothetical protein
MKPRLRSASANQRRTEVAKSAAPISAKKETVLSDIIVIAIINSSLMLLSQFLCGAKHFDANRGPFSARAWDRWSACAEN